MASDLIRCIMLAVLLGMSSLLQAQTTSIPFSSTTGGASYSAQGDVMLWSSMDGGACSIVNSNTTRCAAASCWLCRLHHGFRAP